MFVKMWRVDVEYVKTKMERKDGGGEPKSNLLYGDVRRKGDVLIVPPKVQVVFQ